MTAPLSPAREGRAGQEQLALGRRRRAERPARGGAALQQPAGAVLGDQTHSGGLDVIQTVHPWFLTADRRLLPLTASWLIFVLPLTFTKPRRRLLSGRCRVNPFPCSQPTHVSAAFLTKGEAALSRLSYTEPWALPELAW